MTPGGLFEDRENEEFEKIPFSGRSTAAQFKRSGRSLGGQTPQDAPLETATNAVGWCRQQWEHLECIAGRRQRMMGYEWRWQFSLTRYTIFR